MRAEYGLNLRDALAGHTDLTLLDLADLVANLPPGCALWRASGGDMAWSYEMHMLARVEYGVRVLAWQKTADGAKGRNRPEPVGPPKPAHEIEAEQRELSRRAEAYMRRTGHA